MTNGVDAEGPGDSGTPESVLGNTVESSDGVGSSDGGSELEVPRDPRVDSIAANKLLADFADLLLRRADGGIFGTREVREH